jgi:CRP-like cAMP-binding protein
VIGREPGASGQLFEAAGSAPIVIGGSIADLAGLPEKPAKWLAWDLHGEPGFATGALSAGALAVLPETASADDLARAAARLAAIAPESAAPRDRHHRARSVIPAKSDTTVEIVEGVVARVAVHPEGDEVLLGLHGPGELLPGHPDDDCYVELVAATDIVIRAWPWDGIRTTPGLAARLRDQLVRAEAWAAVRARPTVELRLLGILGQLAGRFGEDARCGQLIPFRLTHAMLASAIGATRSTVSRTMAELERSGYLCYEGEGSTRRIVVAQAAPGTISHA